MSYRGCSFGIVVLECAFVQSNFACRLFANINVVSLKKETFESG